MTLERQGSGLALVATLLLLAGCPKEGGGGAPADAAASAPADASSGAESSDAGRAPSPAGPRSYAGKYTATPGTLYIPEHKDYASVRQAKSDDTKLVGDGTVTIEIGADGRVAGTIDAGPAAPAVLEGTLQGDEIRGTVRRKDPADQGLTGVFLGTLAGRKLEGTLELADASAAHVRAATFAAEQK